MFPVPLLLLQSGYSVFYNFLSSPSNLQSYLFTSPFLLPRVLDIVVSLSCLFVGSVVLFPPAVPNPAPFRSR